MKAYMKDQELAIMAERRGIKLTIEDARTLRRAELTLQKWGEQECGDGNDHSSWAIERDETTGKPYRCVYPHHGKMRQYPVADRERGALKRVGELCKRLGLHFYYQTDPRGAMLYVSDKPINDQNYSTSALCCCL